MRKHKKILALAWIGLLSSALLAQPEEHSLSLKDALQYGLQNSIQIRQAALDQKSADYQIGEVRSSGLPQLNGEGQLQNFPNLPTQLLPGEIIGQPGTQIPVQFGTKYTMSGGVQASQLLYNQQFLTGLRAAKSSRELYQLLKIKTEEDVIYNISQAFYKALDLQAQIEVIESNMTMLEQLEELTRVQYENDLVTKTNYSRVKVNKANLASNLQALKTGEEQQKNYLKLLIGMPMEATLQLKKPAGLENVELSGLQYQKEEPVELEILQKQKALNILNKKNIRAGYFPTLSAFAQQSWQAQRNEFNFFDNEQPWFQQTVIGLSLQVPIFDGLSKHYRVQQSKIDIQKLELDQENTRRALDMQFENAREQLVNSLKSVEAQRENKQLANEVYDETQLLYKEQVATLSELLDVENDFRQAQVNYFKELLKFKLSELDLLKSQGQLQQILN